MSSLPDSAFSFVYVQGHGIEGQYIPKDYYVTEDNDIEGLTTKDAYEALFESGDKRRLLLVSDHCHVGNYYALRYRLVPGDISYWEECSDWNGKVPTSWAIHFSATLKKESAQESNISGGFFTDAFSKIWNNQYTLAERLLEIRRLVSDRMSTHKDKLDIDEFKQTPQVYASFRPDPNDPDVLKKFELGPPQDD